MSLLLCFSHLLDFLIMIVPKTSVCVVKSLCLIAAAVSRSLHSLEHILLYNTKIMYEISQDLIIFIMLTEIIKKLWLGTRLASIKWFDSVYKLFYNYWTWL